MVSLRAEGKSDRVGRRDGMIAFRDQAFTARSNRCGVPGTGSLLVGDRKRGCWRSKYRIRRVSQISRGR